MAFIHHDQESLYEAWERFKDLLRKFPHHSLPKWLQVQTFYNAFSPNIKIAHDAAAGGSFERKEIDEAYDLIEEMATNSHYQSSSERRKTAGINEIDAISALNAKVDNMVRKLDLLTTKSVNSIMQTCDRCNEPHGIGECMLDSANPQTLEQVNYMMNQGRRNYPYSNPYDNNLRNHPNLSYGNSNNTLNATPGFLPPEKKSHDDLLTALSKSHMDFMNETREHNKIQQAAIRNLEIQMGQFANMMAARPQGTLPSNTEKNPKEQVQAITLGSGRQLEDKPRKEKEKEEERKAPIIDLVEKEEVKPYVPPVPFPQRLKKTQDDKSFMKFLDVFKKLQINIPFAEALTQMPSYAKFLKEILSKKRKIDDQGMAKLIEECSAIIQNKLPPKRAERKIDDQGTWQKLD
ncbi:uncharacterized protein LOC105634587 [Jatropha curcas]|uniref:uncharacterized protein LOC105634587 n=1 Tax=Jatropha curcas TaxID=180498 RepID=UPI001895C188|nr:uncharacterized protein LOC105634587 [Jatropha curcas]